MVTAFTSSEKAEVIGWKYRKGGWLKTSPPKETWWADGSTRSLFGIHLWDGEPCNVFLCEGETDAMRLFQLLGETQLVLALAGQPSNEQFTEWLSLIETIVGGDSEHALYLAFDNDAPGVKYTRFVNKHYHLLHRGIELGDHKDVCDWSDANPDDLPTWERLPKLPSSVRKMSSIVQELRVLPEPISQGITTGLADLDFLTTGYYPGSFLMVAAPGKQGKSSLVNDLTVKYVKAHGKQVMLVPLELTDVETTLLMGADAAGVSLYDSDTSDVLAGCDSIADSIYVVRHFGKMTIDQLNEVFDTCEELDVKLIVIDHITAAATDPTDGMQTSQLDAMLYTIKAKLNELSMSCICVTHVNSDENERVSVRTLRGSRALSQVPTTVLGLARVEDGSSRLYTILPDRRTGREGIVELLYTNGSYSPANTIGGKLL